MIGYILRKQTFTMKGIFEFNRYEFTQDLEFGTKSKLTQLSPETPEIEDDDIVLCKDGNAVIFCGICDTFETSGKSGYNLQLKQAECLFDRNIFISSPEMISQTGFEDFITKSIEDNWIDSGDPLMDASAMTVTALTHTQLAVIPESKDGIINLMDLIAQAKEYWGIRMIFDVENGALAVKIEKDPGGEISLDTKMSDVQNLSERFSVNILAKLHVRWKIPDTESNGVVTAVGPVTDVTYYLTTTGAVTTNIGDPQRVDGIIDAMYIETKESEEVLQKVVDAFQKNKYDHNISFDMHTGSRAYPAADFYVGRKIKVKTKKGITESIISARTIKNDSAYAKLTLGTQKVSLIAKIRNLQRRES